MSNKHTNTIILGIETSCDETSAAVFSGNVMLSNIIATQEVHKNFGGVVPELASREHQKNIIPVVNEAINIAGISKKDINAVAFTRGPGLPGSLMVGVSFAKAFALALGVSLIEVNHMQAHILAHFILTDSELSSNPQKPTPSFPFLCLTVSGGHTQIVLVRDYLDMEVIGQTLDDAAGEAFDKAAKIMGIPYPGGPLIDKFAQDGNPKEFSFPEPQVDELNFSFSGLKTSFLYFIQKQMKTNSNFIDENKNDLCASLQHTIINILLKKLSKASEQTGINEIALAGGVSANSGLRNGLNVLGEKKKWNIYIPPMQYCTDNAAMIAVAGYFKFKNKDFAEQTVTPLTRMGF
ncbi:MAG: tRNA (adenosine(37)-N6)-threonylcarbamoyltransferase complex transferase subunit TsaD [Bacteroidia bacterium]|nr:tRNA (adenosine(37)-N6)-threonylcarbamoyltransferase complex transferase subunit TsaD [Bacteroidia bacterium]